MQDSHSPSRGVRSTGGSIMLGFTVVLCLMVLLTVVGITQVNRMNGALAAINDVHGVKQRYAITFRGSVHDRSIALRDAVLAAPAELRTLVAEIDRLKRQYDEAAAPMDALFAQGADVSALERETLAGIKAIETRTLPVVQRLLTALERGDAAQARPLLDQARPLFVQWLAAINRMIDLEERLMKDQSDMARRVGVDFQQLMLALTGAAILLGAGLAWLIARRITRALGRNRRRSSVSRKPSAPVTWPARSRSGRATPAASLPPWPACSATWLRWWAGCASTPTPYRWSACSWRRAMPTCRRVPATRRARCARRPNPWRN
ncbi:MCP four helix bundle domain-containing protein [Achromobacter xylosoxidans]